GAGPLIVYGTDTADEWKALVDSAAAAEGVQVRGGGDGFGASDQTSFYARGLPVLHFFTNVHADYHRPSDDWEKIDGPGLERVAVDAKTQSSRRSSPLGEATCQAGCFPAGQRLARRSRQR